MKLFVEIMYVFCASHVVALWIVNWKPQIYTRDTRLHIPSRVMALSAMGLNLGIFGIFPTTHAKANATKKCVPTT